LGIDVERLASFELIAQVTGLGLGSFSEFSRIRRQKNSVEEMCCYDPDPETDGPRCLVKREKLLEVISQAIDQLPRDERLVIALHYYEELTVKEIAAVLRVGVWKVLQLHTKAVLRLRTRLRLHIGLHERIARRSIQMKVIRGAGSVRNAQKLGVVIERFPPEFDESALYQEHLRTQVENRLRHAGIEVLPEQEAISHGFPYLYVNVNLLKTEVGLYVFTTRICLKQTVLLPPEPLVKLYTSTWDIGAVGTVEADNLRMILGTIRRQVDQFCHDHLVAGLDSNGETHRECLPREATPPARRHRVPGWIKPFISLFSTVEDLKETRAYPKAD
jgi:hypothetical protein